MWQKDGKIFVNPLIWNNRKIYNPTEAQLLEAGYVWQNFQPSQSVISSELEKVRASFWDYVQIVAENLSLPLSDFPTSAYSAELLSWCSEHGLDADTTADLAIKFCGIAADLSRIGYRWDDLFPAPEGEELSAK